MHRTLLLMLVAAGLFAARPDPNGVWKLDTAASDFGGAQTPSGLTLDIKVEGPEMYVTQSYDGQELKLHMSTDGRKMTNEVPAATMTTVHKWDGEVLVGDTRIEGDGWSVTFKDRMTYAADGKTLTIARDATMPDGERKQKLIFTKQ